MSLDAVLDLLGDGGWHEVEEIVRTLGLSEKQVELIIVFYERFRFIEYDRSTGRVMVDPQLKTLL